MSWWGHAAWSKVARGRRVRVRHRVPRHVGRRVHERVRGREGVLGHRARGRGHHARVWGAWGRGRARLCRGCCGRFALPGRAGGGLGYRGGIVAETEGLEGARGLGLGLGVVEGIGVGSRGLRRGVRLLLLLGRGLLVGGGWVS